MRKLWIWEFGVLLASSLNYASALTLSVIWRLDPFLHLVPLIFAIACLVGFMVIDLKRSLIYTYVALFVGVVIATSLLSAPMMMNTASAEEISASAQIILGAMSRVLIVGVIVCVLGMFLGCFLGDWAQEQTFDQIEI